MPTLKYSQKFNKNTFEKRDWAEDKLICGIDEVGRGCLAGPVMVGAVILHPNKTNRLVKDSKLMTAQEREKAYTWIIKNSWHAVALVDHKAIDTLNIYQATLVTMRRAFMQLACSSGQKPATVLVDAMPLCLKNTPFEEINVFHFPFGERKSSSIAAASIVAKVTRDRLMAKYDTVFHDYNFGQHKGYSTPEHKKAVRQTGHSIIHRINFLRGWGLLPEQINEQNQQQTITFITEDDHEQSIR